jgi:fumarate reductase subunit C
MDGWWRRNPYFTRYMLREATSVFVALYAIVLLIGAVCLAFSEVAYGSWLLALQHPAAIAFHMLALVAAVYHTVTWIAVSPKTMPPLYVRGRKLPDALIIAGQYLVAAALSLAILIVAWTP